MTIKIQNVSEMSFSYQWNFLEDEMDNFSINEVFDILPLSGFLQPGECENVEFIFNSVVNHKVKAVAVCHVEGGPDYEVSLEGDSSLISYKISTNLLELGEVRFCDWVQKEFFIENTGKVQFNFSIAINKIIRKGLVEVLPRNGKINGNEK
jgi:hydrocephalus-inducing protein